MASAAQELLDKIAEFLIFRYYVLCPHCSLPNILGDDDQHPEGGFPVCWSCRRNFRYDARDVREYRPSPR